MKIQEIKELSVDELELKLADKVEELYNLRFQHAMHQLDNPLLLRGVRKDIARIKTILKSQTLKVDDSKVEVEKQ